MPPARPPWNLGVKPRGQMASGPAVCQYYRYRPDTGVFSEPKYYIKCGMYDVATLVEHTHHSYPSDSPSNITTVRLLYKLGEFYSTYIS